MKEINKQEAEARIASIEAEAESLRKLINQQNTEESQAAPEADEVWEDGAGRRFIMCCAADEKHCELPTFDCDTEVFNNAEYEEEHFIKRLGNFEDVYVERSKLREAGYIHKDEIARVLTKDREFNNHSRNTRLHIADSLEIENY